MVIDGGLHVERLSSVIDVDEGAWDQLVTGSNFYVSHAWLSSSSRTWSDWQACLVARDGGGRIVGGLPVQLVRQRTASLYDPAIVFAAAGGAIDPSAIFPFLLAGPRSGYCGEIPLAGERAGGAGSLVALLTALAEAAAETGARGQGLLFLRHEAAAGVRQPLADAGYTVFVQSFEVRLQVPWTSFDQHVGWLPSKRRNVVRKDDQHPGAHGLRVERTRLAGHEATIAPLAANVERRYGHSADAAALERTLRGQTAACGAYSVLFLLMDGDRVVGYSSHFEWRGTLFLRSVGFDYEHPHVRGAYFTLALYEPLRYAMERGLTELHLGTEGYQAKVLRGGLVWPLWAAVQAPPLGEPEARALVQAGRARALEMEAALNRPVQGLTA